MSVVLRPATLEDLPGIVAVFLACWRESYRGVLPDAAIDAMTGERASALWTRVLGSTDGTTVVAADDDSEIRGITRWVGADVHSLYVDPHAHGGGIGTRLLAHATDAIRATGAPSARLWVFAENAPSRAFYASRGWNPNGVTRTQEEFGEPEIQCEIVLSGQAKP